MKLVPRCLRTPLKVALVIATIVTSWQAFRWSYYNLSPAGRKEVAMARAEALFQEGLEAMHRRGDRIATMEAWSKALAICRAHSGTEADQAGLNTHIADVLIELGRDAEALARYEAALDLYGRTKYTSIEQEQCRQMIAELRARL